MKTQCPKCGHAFTAKPKEKAKPIHFLWRGLMACGAERSDELRHSTYWEHVSCGSCKRSWAWQASSKKRGQRRC